MVTFADVLPKICLFLERCRSGKVFEADHFKTRHHHFHTNLLLRFFALIMYLMTRLDYKDASFVERSVRDLWNILSETDRAMLLSTVAFFRYKKNEMIYNEGDSPEQLLCLVSGRVKIYRDGYGGRSIINRVLRPVQYFGYRASMAGEPYVTAAAAFEESVIATIPMSFVYDVMKRNAELSAFFIRALATDLGLADKRIVSLTQKHVRGRLAEALLTLLDIYGYDSDGQTLDLHISREDLAGLSNMTTANAIRTLMSFAEERLVEVKGRRIKLLNVELLRQTSSLG